MRSQKHCCTLVALGCLSVGAVGANAEEAATTAPSADNTAGMDVLQEVMVTATRQERSLSKVPLSIVATDQEALDKQGIRTTADLMRLTPSITFGQSGQFYGTGQSQIAIRGIQSTSGIPTTGVYIDDTPIQTRTGISPSLGNAYPKMFDLDRIEVLRGPQGTLFGTGSMGGAVRFITPDPVMDVPTMYTRSEVGSTQHGGVSYEQGIAGGAPIIEDKLGFRASAWHRYDSGYVDRLDPVTKQIAKRDINSERSTVGRLALGWKPLENVTITPSVFYQKSDTADAGLLELAASDIDNNDYRTSLYNIPQYHDDTFTLPGLKVSVDFADVTFISNSSYFTRETSTVSDDSALNLTLWAGYTGPWPPPGFEDFRSKTDNATTQRGFTQEFRLQSADPNARLNWVIGAFYSDATTRDAFDAANPELLRVINFGLDLAGEPQVSSVAEFTGAELYQGLYVVSQRSRYHDVQHSLFAQADYEIVPRLKLTAGLRYTDATFKYRNFVAGPLYASDGTTSNLESDGRPVTPKFGIAFQATDDQLFYANAAKGVRGSGVAEPVGERCVDDAAAIGFDPLSPRSIKSDSVWSYEVGSKNKLADGRFGIDAAAYRVKWEDVQTTLVLPGCQVNTTLNLGSAQVDGVDLSLSLLPLSGLWLGASVSYMDAEYTQQLSGPDDIVIRRKGEPLDVAPWSMHFSGDYTFTVNTRDFYVRADYTRSTHDSTPVDQNSPLVDPGIPRAPATSVLDLRTGIRIGELDISLFASNVLNDNPMLSIGRDATYSTYFRSTTFRPRTIGLTATFRR